MSILATIEKYSHDVLDGNVVACLKHRQACARFLSDLEKSRTDEEYPFYFDEDKAEDFVEWTKLFKHTRGVLAGQHIALAPIQLFIFGNVYGWLRKDNHYRRFTTLYWQVARKNAKSQSLSLVALYELFISTGDELSEVYAAAAKKEQARIVYDECVLMLRGCEYLEEGEHYKVAYGRITKVSNGSFMRALSKEDKKTGDGLNPQCGIIDEYHAHETDESYNIIESGQGARKQPLLAIITTAGFELNNPCYRVEYDLVKKLLDPNKPTEIEDYFAMVNELESNESDEAIEVDGRTIKPGELIDNIEDPAVWPKANPITCSYPEGVERIRSKLAKALEAPEKMRDFMTKNVNVWVNERSFGYMNMAKWSKCEHPRESFKELIRKEAGPSCWVGLDLSAKLDLSAASFEFVGKDERYYVFSHAFMPREMFTQKLATDKVPYDLWESQGWLTVTEGAVVDYRAIKKYVLDIAETNNWLIEEVCVDPWGATQLTGDFMDDGINVVEIVQGYKTLSEPTKNFREMVYSNRVVHDGSPVLTWAMGNAVTRLDYNMNMTLDKSKAKQRIDPAAALINAHVRAMVSAQSGSIYEKRGMRSL